MNEERDVCLQFGFEVFGNSPVTLAIRMLTLNVKGKEMAREGAAKLHSSNARRKALHFRRAL